MSLNRSYLNLMAEGDGMDRIIFFSDAVFAIAMTLLVIELRVPEAAPHALGAALVELLPGYLAFMLSFVVIAIVWMSHHRKLGVVVRYDQNLIRLNLLLLLFVASIPLPTGILAAYGGDNLSVFVYAGTICAVGFTMTGIWMYAWHRGLIAPQIRPELFRYVLVKSLPIPGIFLLSIPVALLAGATIAEFSWVLAVPASLIITRIYGSRLDPHGEGGEKP